MNNGTARHQEFSPRESSKVLARYRRSGLGAVQFAQEHGIQPGRLHYWAYEKGRTKSRHPVQVSGLVTGVGSRLFHRYGDRGYRYLLIEAGHVGQNLALLATATGVGSLSLGGFYDDEVSSMLGLNPNFEFPLYGIALGLPETTNRAEARGLSS